MTAGRALHGYPLARPVGFALLVAAVALVLLRAGSARSAVVYDQDGGIVGILDDGTDFDGGGSPRVVSAPGEPTLRDRMQRVLQCPRTHQSPVIVTIELYFREDGTLLRIDEIGTHADRCTRAAFFGTHVVPFAGPVQHVRILVRHG